jgi:xylulokinase
MLLGIDVGTTGVRAAVFEPDGRLVADASVPCGYDSPRAGFAEADPRKWWDAVVAALARVPCANASAIAVVGQAPTAVLVDASGEPTAPAILWLDTRADAEAKELGTQAYYLGPKLLWLSRHAPDALSRAKWILQSHAYIAQKLTGEAATDPSTAALCIPLFDLASKRWVHDARIGVREDQLPPIRASHEVIGTVTPPAATATGLRAGTPVVSGGGDFAAATLGAGVIEEGEACLMLGTAGNLLVPLSRPGTDARMINSHHVGADVWLSLGGTLSGGAQEWLRASLGKPSFEDLDAEASRIPAGSEGLLFLPYLQGERTPIWDVNARGAYVGLSLQHGRGHLWRALLEGIALSFADCASILNAPLRSVLAANGGGKSALFRQILCDALGVPLEYAPSASGTVAGAAVLAGLASNQLPSAASSRAFRGPLTRHTPSGASIYQVLLSLRRESYAGLSPVFSGLATRR